jgi:NAD(P)H-hydrate epimerase
MSIIAPRFGLHILQTTVIEAMVELYGETVLEGTYLPKGACFAIGPGIGQDKRTVKFLEVLFRQLSEPIILDADALNILSQQPTLLNSIPKNSILTPHPKEFERLVGPWNNDEQKIQKLLDFSKKHRVYILLKGAYTAITCPEGQIYFNTTGNLALATAGSGDVLTGLLGSFLAQGFTPLQSAQLGAFIHGKAGDEVEKETTARVLTAAMLPNAFAKVFKWLN